MPPPSNNGVANLVIWSSVVDNDGVGNLVEGEGEKEEDYHHIFII
jgi:hypothetical protein